MKYLYRSGRRTTLRSMILRQAAILAVSFLGTMNDGAIQAAPVTLTFEAEIDRVFLGIPFDSGIEFDEGDIISGEFTFAPDDGDGGMFFEETQPYGFTLNINGVRVKAPSYVIRAVDDGSVTDVPGVSGGPIDMLELNGGGLSVIDAHPDIDINPILSGFRASLWGPTLAVPDLTDVLLQTAMVPGDVATWNQFILRRQIHVSFENGEGGAIGFQATVGDFSIVPEPSMWCLSFQMLIAITMFLGRRFCRT